MDDSELKHHISNFFSTLFCKDIIPLFTIPSNIDFHILESIKFKENQLKKNNNKKLKFEINKLKISESYRFMTHKNLVENNYLENYKKKIAIVLNTFGNDINKFNLHKDLKKLIESKYDWKQIQKFNINNINEYFCIKFSKEVFNFYKNNKYKILDKIKKIIKLIHKLI